jgi:hypothetical protein
MQQHFRFRVTGDDRLSNRGKDEKFENVLLGAVDEAFSLLGEEVKKALYFHLEHDLLIAKQDIPDRIDDFSDALERVFGIGARQLELLIMQKLHQKISASYKWEGPNWLIPDLTFVKYVKLMELSYNDQGKKIGNLEIMVADEEEQQQKV